MKAASDKQSRECNRFINSTPPPLPGPALDCMGHLHRVANTLSQAQQQRHTADYDSATQWTRTEALTLIAQVNAAFESWHAIRQEPAAQAYLISLLGTPKGMSRLARFPHIRYCEYYVRIKRGEFSL